MSQGSQLQSGEVDLGVLREPLLTPADAAKLLSVPTSWVYDAVRRERLPCVRVGRHIRFTRTLLERWLTDHTRAA